MITQQELNALVELLQRTPLSRAEALWVQVFTVRLQAMIVQEDRRRAVMSQRTDEAERMEAPGGRTGSTTGED